VLGLNDQEMVLLVLTFVLSMLTFVTRRTNILFGLVHVVCLPWLYSWYSSREI
jgi:Ca2+:H+ antiporter